MALGAYIKLAFLGDFASRLAVWEEKVHRKTPVELSTFVRDSEDFKTIKRSVRITSTTSHERDWNCLRSEDKNSFFGVPSIEFVIFGPSSFEVESICKYDCWLWFWRTGLEQVLDISPLVAASADALISSLTWSACLDANNRSETKKEPGATYIKQIENHGYNWGAHGFLFLLFVCSLLSL